MKFSNKAYDTLKWIEMLFLPALAAFYLGLAEIWGLPYGEAVSGTIMLLDTLLGAILGISNAKYKKANASAPAVAEEEVG